MLVVSGVVARMSHPPWAVSCCFHTALQPPLSPILHYYVDLGGDGAVGLVKGSRVLHSRHLPAPLEAWLSHLRSVSEVGNGSLDGLGLLEAERPGHPLKPLAISALDFAFVLFGPLLISQRGLIGRDSLFQMNAGAFLLDLLDA